MEQLIQKSRMIGKTTAQVKSMCETLKKGCDVFLSTKEKNSEIWLKRLESEGIIAEAKEQWVTPNLRHEYDITNGEFIGYSQPEKRFTGYLFTLKK